MAAASIIPTIIKSDGVCEPIAMQRNTITTIDGIGNNGILNGLVISLSLILLRIEPIAISKYTTAHSSKCDHCYDI